MNDVLEFAKSILHGDNKHKAWLMGEAEKWVAQQDKLYFHEDGVEMYPVPQLEGKPLSEAELEAIRERDAKFKNVPKAMATPSPFGWAVDDRSDLLQHIAWLTAEIFEQKVQVTYEQNRNLMNIASYSDQVNDLQSKLTSASARCKVLGYYVRHKPDCEGAGLGGDYTPEQCTCGLQQALSQAEVKE